LDDLEVIVGAKHNINIDTLKVSPTADEGQFAKGGIVRIMDGTKVTLISEYGGWNAKPTGMEEGILNIKEGLELSSYAKKVLMLIAIYRVMEKRDMNPGISASSICNKSVIPVTGFTGMYVYFSLGMRKDRIDTHHFTINHDVVSSWQTVAETYKTMSEQINHIPKLIENINKEYIKVKKKAERMMFKSKLDAKMAMANSKA
jgi:hypothetical protein